MKAKVRAMGYISIVMLTTPVTLAPSAIEPFQEWATVKTRRASISALCPQSSDREVRQFSVG